MTVVVTGGAGFIGRHLVQRLAANRAAFGAAGEPVVALDNLHRSTPTALADAIEAGDVRLYEGDVRDAGTLEQAMRAAEARRLVFTSSREVYGQPQSLPVHESAPLAPKNAYGASKAAGEMSCRVAAARGGLEVVALRLANVYGPGDSGRVIPLWLERAARGEDLHIFGG